MSDVVVSGEVVSDVVVRWGVMWYEVVVSGEVVSDVVVSGEVGSNVV